MGEKEEEVEVEEEEEREGRRKRRRRWRRRVSEDNSCTMYTGQPHVHTVPTQLVPSCSGTRN